MRISVKGLTTLSAPVVTVIVAASIALIGWVDYATGVEIRVLPLYYLPLSMAAWDLGRRGAVIASVLCALVWMASNYLAGMHYSSEAIWGINLAMQGTSFIVVGLLIAAVRTSYQQVEQLSRTDSLTMLLNARAFADEAGRVLAIGRRHHHAATVVYIDLDNFKDVNDGVGHHEGDRVLRATADLLRQALRAGDVVARIGGDEFVVLLPETDAHGAAPLIERLRLALHIALSTERYTISASIGAVSFAEPPANIEAAVRKADEVMYAAKSAGKNCARLEIL
jgi:diguanylate cyclase (GGDEF)-like protein